ncbi:MAG: polysaccharide biosynthesis C-terminal domain-containing protein, partial [Candidatus Omnitrophota bacterium]|nr:polysaccharide biosynthesis C-terminal domain-containing protein [Candidatus Omnitrophota bacterium]
AMITIVYTLCAFVYDFGMINALFRWVYQYKEDEIVLRRRVASTSLIFLLVLASFLTIVLWNEAGFISNIIFKNAGFSGLIRLMLIGLFLQSLTWVPLSLLRIQEKPIMLISIAMSGMAAMVLFNYILLSNGMGLKGIYVSSIISYALILPALFYVTRSYYVLDFSLKELKGMLKFGLPFFPVLFFSWIIDFSGRFFLGRYSTLEQVGLYSIGYKIGQILYLAEKTFAIAWVPLMLSLAHKYSEKAPEVFGKVFTYFIFSSMVLFLACSIFSKEILRMFTSAPYFAAYRVVPLIALSYVLYGIYGYMLSGLTITKKIHLQPFIFLGAAALNVLMNMLLIPGFGMMGAAFSAAASYVVIAAATYYCAQKFYPIPIELKRLFKILAASAAVYLLTFFTDFKNLALSFAYKSVVLAGFFWILYISGFFSTSELDKLRTFILRRKRA